MGKVKLPNFLDSTAEQEAMTAQPDVGNVDANGLGLSGTTAEGLAASFESAFSLLSETPDIFPAWKALVGALGVIGKQVHDARLVAVCHVHAVTHLLTFNVLHFVRMAGSGPGVIVVDPASM